MSASFTAKTVASISNAPAAPRAWPNMDLLAEMASFSRMRCNHRKPFSDQGRGLGQIIDARAGAMGVNVVDFFRHSIRHLSLHL